MLISRLKYNLILLIFINIVLILISKTNINANEILFTEDFSSGDLSNWTSNSINNWFVENGELIGTTSAGQSVPYYIMTGNSDWTNYIFQADVMAEWGIDKSILFYINNNNNALRFNLRSWYPGGVSEHGDDFILTERKPMGTTGTVRLSRILDFINYTNQWYTIKAEIMNKNEGVNIKGYVNDTLLVDYLDTSNQYEGGKIGFETWTGYEGERLHFDNVKVEKITTTEPTLVNLPVPDLKQYTSPWGSQVYDNATFWSTDPYISRWGCALASASMILQYHNHKINPGELNSWLKSQEDGFIRNGLINWLSLTRFTLNNNSKVDSDRDLSTLEFIQSVPNSDLEKASINNKIPIIYKLPGHFVVGRGYELSKFIINDPFSESNKYLSDAEKRYGFHQSFIQYIPSETDLSYIYLVINNNIEAEILNNDGVYLLNQFTTVDKPIINELIMLSEYGNNETVKSIYIQKPENGFYKINLMGNQVNFKLDAYLYDQNGNVNMQEIRFDINGPKNLLLDFDSENKFIFDSKFIEILNFLKKLKSEGKIKSSYYQYLYNHLVTINRFELNNKLLQSKHATTQLIYHLNKFNPKNISQEDQESLRLLVFKLENSQ